MVEKKTVGSRILQGFFVVILVILALSCLLPLLYNLAVSFSSKEAAEAGLVTFWPVGFTLQAYKEIMGEKAFFVSFFVSAKRVIYSHWRSPFRCLPSRLIPWRRRNRNLRPGM